MYKLRPLDDSANGFYCPLWMRCSYRTAPFSARLCALVALTLHCKSEAPPEATHSSTLQLEILALNTEATPGNERPFIAGEEARLTLKVQGGQPPYDLQLATAAGAPTLANAATRVEADPAKASPSEAMEVGMDLRLASEVPTGTYALLLRVTDHEGVGASVRSDPFEVIGVDAPVVSPAESKAQLKVVDVAGRARASFYQGEGIHIRALVNAGEEVAVGILASDDRPFMPVRKYTAAQAQFNLSLRIPRLARPGDYRIQFATKTAEASVPLRVIGATFGRAKTPVLEELLLLGGKDFRVPRRATLRRGEEIRIEARVGGIYKQSKALLRLRTRAGQVVAHAELGDILPSDPHPAARSMLTATWTPAETLSRGRHVLEIEISEGDDLATLYREVVLR
jgi:hypothetical protein